MRHRMHWIHAVFASGFVIALAAIVLVTGIAAKRQNQQASASHQVIVGYEIQETYEYLRGQVRQMVYWQDTFDRSIRKWDAPWISYQFGRYQETMGNYYTAIIGPDRVIHFLNAPKDNPGFNRTALLQARSVSALLEHLWRAGARQPPPMPGGIVLVDGKVYAAVGSLITPENKEDLVDATRTPLAVIFFKPLTIPLFNEFRHSSGPQNLYVALKDTAPSGYQEFPLRDVDGKPIAWLRWMPNLPGNQFTRDIAVPLIGLMLVFALIQLMVVSRWMKLQRKMLRAKVEARTAHEQSRMKSVFLGTISHELRTPLNAIIGYADVLCSQMFGSLGNPRNSEYVHVIRASGRDLLRTVNDLIEVARIEARDTGGENDAFDPVEPCRHAIQALQEKIDEKHLHMALIRCDATLTCHGSQLGLSQAIERILINAIRHTPENGCIVIEIADEGGHARIEIRDTGEGIAPERLEDLARPFGHPDNHLVACTRGMGFGIPIAKGLLQLMGGRFEIESTLGKGTTVRLHVRADKAHKPTAAAVDEPRTAVAS